MLYHRYPPKRKFLTRSIPGKKETKESWQRQILYDMFKNLRGQISQKTRDHAVKCTGLEWRQIYKWIFDRFGSTTNRQNDEINS